MTAPMPRKRLLVLGTLAGLSCGTSDDLTRRSAETMIREVLRAPTAQTLTIVKRYSWMNGDRSQILFFGTTGSARATYVEALKNNGLITLTEPWSRNEHNVWFDFDIVVTDLGRRYVTSESRGFVTFTICDVDFGEITGIRVNRESQAATAEYSLKRANWTPFGELLKGTEYELPAVFTGATASLTKYDDGWRLTEPLPSIESSATIDPAAAKISPRTQSRPVDVLYEGAPEGVGPQTPTPTPPEASRPTARPTPNLTAAAPPAGRDRTLSVPNGMNLSEFEVLPSDVVMRIDPDLRKYLNGKWAGDEQDRVDIAALLKPMYSSQKRDKVLYLNVHRPVPFTILNDVAIHAAAAGTSALMLVAEQRPGTVSTVPGQRAVHSGPSWRRAIPYYLRGPKASAPDANTDDTPIVLELPNQGPYQINKELVAAEELLQRLETVFRPRPDKVLFVTADAGVPYEAVVGAMDIARTAGVVALRWMPWEQVATNRWARRPIPTGLPDINLARRITTEADFDRCSP